MVGDGMGIGHDAWRRRIVHVVALADAASAVATRPP
jgi:hypothetical protein